MIVVGMNYIYMSYSNWKGTDLVLWSARLSPCCRPCRSAQVQPSLRILQKGLQPHNFSFIII